MLDLTNWVFHSLKPDIFFSLLSKSHFALQVSSFFVMNDIFQSMYNLARKDLFDWEGSTVADPDLQIRRGGGGGGAVSKNFFWPLGPQYSLKIMEGPGSATALTISIEFCFQLLYCNDPTSSKYSNNPRVTTFNFWSKTKKLLVIWGCYGLSRF